MAFGAAEQGTLPTCRASRRKLGQQLPWTEPDSGNLIGG